MSVTIEEVKQAEELAEKYHEAYRSKHDVFHAILVQYVTEKYRCAKGELVVGLDGELMKVVGIKRLWDYGKPWLVVHRKNKAGEWGKGEHTCYSDWKPTPSTVLACDVKCVKENKL